MRHESDWKVTIIKSPIRHTVSIFMYRFRGDGKTEVLHSGGNTVAYDEGQDFNNEPTLDIDRDLLQALVDELRNEKPTEGLFIEGELTATKKHLQDMRTLMKLK